MARKKTYAIGESAVPGLPQRAYPQCDWTSNNRGCRYPGTMTSSTVADDKTRWFCSAHFGCTNPILGADIVEASQDYQHQDPAAKSTGVQAHMLAWLHAYGLSPRDGESAKDYRTRIAAQCTGFTDRVMGRSGNTDWARKIMARVANGEAVPIIAEQMARQALGDHGRTEGV